MTDRERPDTDTEAPAETTTSVMPEAAPDAEPAPGSETPGSRRSLAYGVAGLVLFLAGVAVWPLAGPWLEPLLPGNWQSIPAELGEIRTRLAALEARPTGGETVDLAPLQAALAREAEVSERAVGDLKDRITAVEQQVQALPQPDGADAGAVDALTRRLDEMQGGMGAIGSNTETLQRIQGQGVAAAEAVKGLESRVAALEKAVGDAAATRRRQGLLLAVGQLAVAVNAGRGYVEELSRLQEFADDDAGITKAAVTLAAGAAAGVPTLAELRRRFGPLAGAIVRTAAAAGDEDWLARAAGRLKSLVTVRRTGEVAGGETDAIVARAEVRLGDGDLAEAVTELSALEGPAADTAAAWLRDAGARLAADRALAELQGRALALLGAS
jgi:hypothetical protein